MLTPMSNGMILVQNVFFPSANEFSPGVFDTLESVCG